MQKKNSGARLSSGENDDRITRVGKIIRAIRFDELPQLLNILKGDMSIVGVRDIIGTTRENSSIYAACVA